MDHEKLTKALKAIKAELRKPMPPPRIIKPEKKVKRKVLRHGKLIVQEKKRKQRKSSENQLDLFADRRPRGKARLIKRAG